MQFSVKSIKVQSIAESSCSKVENWMKWNTEHRQFNNIQLYCKNNQTSTISDSTSNSTHSFTSDYFKTPLRMHRERTYSKLAYVLKLAYTHNTEFTV